MAEVTLRHEIDCDEDTFWNQCVFSEGDDYNRKLYLEYLKFPGYTLLESKDTEDKKTRKVKIDPPLVGIPGPVKKVIGDKLSYVEEGVFDKKTRRYTFTVTPSTMAEKSKTTGELYVEKLGEGNTKRIARIAKIKVEVKVFAIGGMVEDKILGDLKASYDAAAKFTNDWVKAKG
jgi:hypothetical protein